MPPSNANSASRYSAVPRIRPVIPLGFSRTSKHKSSPSAPPVPSPSTVVPSTPPKTDASVNFESAQPHPEPPLTPESTPSNANSRPEIGTPTDSTSDPQPDINPSGPSELHADTAISSPPNSDVPYSARSETLDPLAHFVPQGGEYMVSQTTTPGYYMDAQPGASMGYPMPMMHFGYQGYPTAPTFQHTYHEPMFSPPVLDSVASVFNNGHTLSRSGSHSSQGNAHAAQRSAPHPNRSMSSANHVFEQTLQSEAINLSNYLIAKFCNPEFADYILNITSSTSHPPMSGLPAHGLILARSPTLKFLMFSIDRQHAPTMDGMTVLQIHVEDQFLSPYQLHLGLSHLYSNPLPQLDSTSYSPSGSGGMSAGLGFAAVGRFLQMPHLMSHGTKAALKHLAWINIEEALAFIHEGNRLVSITTYHDHETRTAVIKIENEFLRSVIQFLAYYFPKDFNIHSTAAELTGSPRLPAIHDSRPSISHTRLASIQFGEVSTEDSTKFDNSVLLSSILVSVPTAVLQILFDSQVLGGKLGWAKVSQILRDIIAERECRRVKVRKMPKKRVLPGATAQQWEAVQWEELAQHDERHPAGFVIHRKRVVDDASTR